MVVAAVRVTSNPPTGRTRASKFVSKHLIRKDSFSLQEAKMTTKFKQRMKRKVFSGENTTARVGRQG